MKIIVTGAILLLLAVPAVAKDNNPFSGATSIRVTMHRVHRLLHRRHHHRHGMNMRNFSVFTDRFQSILVWKSGWGS